MFQIYQASFVILTLILMFVCFRAIVVPYDVGRFDAMTSNREVEALEFYGNKAPGISNNNNFIKALTSHLTTVDFLQDRHVCFLVSFPS